MDRRPPATAVPDKLSLAKAAAWAWYASGEGKPVVEMDARRASRELCPTRFKLEALRTTPEPPTPPSSSSECSSSSSPGRASSWSPGSVLMDACEVEMILRQLRCLLASKRDASPAAAHGGGRSGGVRGLGMPWARNAAVVCRSAMDVAEGAVVVRRRRQDPSSGRRR